MWSQKQFTAGEGAQALRPVQLAGFVMDVPAQMNSSYSQLLSTSFSFAITVMYILSETTI